MTIDTELNLGVAVLAPTPSRLAESKAERKAERQRHLKTSDPVLVAEIEEHLKESRVSLGAFASELAYSKSQLSRYLNGRFEGDVDKLESLARQALDNAKLRASVKQKVPTFPTQATRQIANYCATLIRKPQVGLVTGDAGWGKSSGIFEYLKSHPGTLFVVLDRCSGCGVTAIINALCKQIDMRGWKPSKELKGAYVVRKLSESKRLLIIDNAHRLSPRGREWVCDFHDATLSPVLLVGNKHVLPAFEKEDTQSSRIGLYGEVSLLKGERTKDREVELQKAVEQFLEVVWPEQKSALFDLAMKVARGPGHLRSLWHQLSLAQHFVEQHPTMSAVQAFTVAHTRLVRSYRLED